MEKELIFLTSLIIVGSMEKKNNNRINKNKVPFVNETFNLIAYSTYYDKKHCKQVYDYKYDPKKNEINFA